MTACVKIMIEELLCMNRDELNKKKNYIERSENICKGKVVQ